MTNNISVILNGYKRGSCLNKQVVALQNQSHVPSEIMLWYNHPEDGDVNYDIMEKIPSAISNVKHALDLILQIVKPVQVLCF